MPWFFGDSFDLYATPNDMTPSYWEVSASPNLSSIGAGRFGGGAFMGSGSSTFTKSSNANDQVHHITCAYQQTNTALTGSTLGMYLQLIDGGTAQCSIVFRSDGAILLTSGQPNGTILATYPAAVSLLGQWFAFEFEVIISNTAGSFKVRTNGASTDSFVATGLNTRPTSANNYANKLQLGMWSSVAYQFVDDLIWRSDPASVLWIGDVRCYTRMPASDAAIQFSRQGVTAQTYFSGTVAQQANTTFAFYQPFTPTISGLMTSVTFTNHTTPAVNNMKCAIFATNPLTPPAPAALIQAATAPVNCAAVGAGGSVTFTFSPGVPLVAGTTYSIGYISDNNVGFFYGASAPSSMWGASTTPYASWPVSNPSGLTTTSAPYKMIIGFTANTNASLVSEAPQDGVNTYVYSSVVGSTDFYNLAPLAATPAGVLAVTTRAFVQRSDAGSRTGAVALKSGGTTVQSVNGSTLSTAWGWVWRTDQTDPNTGQPWLQSGVDNVQIGPILTA